MHQHDWKSIPTESNRAILRYKCDCGVWGYQATSVRSRRGKHLPIKVYVNGYQPRPTISLSDPLGASTDKGYGPDRWES